MCTAILTVADIPFSEKNLCSMQRYEILNVSGQIGSVISQSRIFNYKYLYENIYRNSDLNF